MSFVVNDGDDGDDASPLDFLVTKLGELGSMIVMALRRTQGMLSDMYVNDFSTISSIDVEADNKLDISLTTAAPSCSNNLFCSATIC